MSKYTIVHLSDMHLSQENISEKDEFYPELINDINKNLDGSIVCVVCSGDLIQSGSKENFEFALEKFITPLLSSFNLREDQFVYVPGNHEVDLKQIDKDFATQFTTRILQDGFTKDDLRKPNVKARLTEFFKGIEVFYPWEQENLVYTHKFEVESLSFGFSLVNSAWNTGGDSSNEAKKILISRDALVTSLRDLADCDKKCLVMHHPIDWLEDGNAAQIESLLSHYDYVFFGHKHNAQNCAIQHMNGVTILHYASKLDIAKEKNGYALLTFDTASGDICINCRTYNKSRLTYVPNTDISDNGKINFKVGSINPIKQRISDVISNTKTKFLSGTKELFITNLIDVGESKSFDDLFIMPIVSTMSELNKDDPFSADDQKDKFDLKEILESHSDVNIWGRKESGKTIFAYYIAKYIYENSQTVQRIPVVVSCKQLLAHKTAIINQVRKNIMDLMDDSYSISVADIDGLLNDGAFIIILDDFDKLPKGKAQLNQLKDKYPNNQMLCFCSEMPGFFSDEDKSVYMDKMEGEVRNYFIGSMDKNSIRRLAKSMASINPAIEDIYVDRVINSFAGNNMPRTPFAVSLVLSICSESADYMPTNQSKILQAFLEKILEKLNPEEVLSRTYNFENKERFLGALAYEMFSKNHEYLTRNEFDEFVKIYHEKKAYDIKDSRFDEVFFEKGILIEYDQFIFFKYECLYGYYLAKYCINDNEEFFWDQIMSGCQYLDNADVVEYYAGFKLNDGKLIHKLVDILVPTLNENSDFSDILEDEQISLEIDIPDDEIEKSIAEGETLSVEEKDALTDLPDNSMQYNPLATRSQREYSDDLVFYLTADLLGEVLRSSEELTAEDKKLAYKTYLNSCIVLWKQFRNSLLEFIKLATDEWILQQKKMEDCDDDEIKKKIDNLDGTIKSIIKLAVPFAVSYNIFSTIGSEKIKTTLVEYYRESAADSIEKLLSLLLICDLKINGWYDHLCDFIKMTSKKDFLWIVFFKCKYYLQMKYFEKNTKKLIAPMADCVISANNLSKSRKSKIMADIEESKAI